MKPINYNFNFRKYVGFDTTALAEKIKSIPDAQWYEFTHRQDLYGPHVHTLTVPVLFNTDLRAKSIVHPFYSTIKTELNELELFLNDRNKGIGTIMRAIIAALLPNSDIPIHKDHAAIFAIPHRFHVPIVTNDKVLFTVGEDTVNMKVGEVWEINNIRSHAVSNKSDERRIHLIVDWEEKDL